METRKLTARVQSAPISPTEVEAAVADPHHGGVALFLGVVRDTNHGKAVTKLEYQAYESMAEKEIGRICAEIAGEIPNLRLCAIHRVGMLNVGDIAVACAASSPHRDEAFRACRLLIDRIKERVPIWKREYGPDGAAWQDWEDARCAH